MSFVLHKKTWLKNLLGFQSHFVPLQRSSLHKGASRSYPPRLQARQLVSLTPPSVTSRHHQLIQLLLMTPEKCHQPVCGSVLSLQLIFDMSSSRFLEACWPHISGASPTILVFAHAQELDAFLSLPLFVPNVHRLINF